MNEQALQSIKSEIESILQGDPASGEFPSLSASSNQSTTTLTFNSEQDYLGTLQSSNDGRLDSSVIVPSGWKAFIFLEDNPSCNIEGPPSVEGPIDLQNVITSSRRCRMGIAVIVKLNFLVIEETNRIRTKLVALSNFIDNQISGP